MSAQVGGGYAGACVAMPNSPNPTSIQPREIEILRLASFGYSYREIADELGWTTQCVKNHANRTFDVLGADNITHAVAQAIRRKLIE